MRAVLVGPEIEENLSVRYLAAALEQAGHQAEVIPFNRTADVGRVTRAVLRRQPPLVGLSLVAQRRYSDYQRLVESLRAGGYRGHIVAGGHFASLRATEVLRDTPGLDTILHHEGEVRLLRLIEWLEARGAGAPTFDGITWRAADRSLRHRAPERVAPLDSLAPPLRKRPDTTLGHRRAPLVASRGCAGQCSFCSISAWHAQVKKARLRLRSAQAVAAEMITLDRERDVRVFVFHDDDFLLPDPKKALARCEEILGTARRGIGRPFAFVLKCRPDDVEPELFAYLGRMGLVRAYVGIETHAPTGLTTLNRRVTQEENERALRVFDQLGLYACFNLLIFDPDSTVAAIEENLRFLRTQLHRPFDVARTELYAGAALEDRMRREGRARGDYRGYDYSIADPRVESMFQLFADVLWERHFGGGSMLHRSQDLGYRLSLCRRLHPEVVRPALAGEIQALIEEVNRDTVTYFERLLARSLEGALDTPARDRFVHEMRREVDRRTTKLARRYHLLSLELESRAALARKGLSHWPVVAGFPTVVRRVADALPYAALALGALSCGEESRVCDPPPAPIRFRANIAPELKESCALAGCHDETTASAGLVLTREQSYAQLVGIPSTELPTMKRVEPGSSSSSYLVHKLAGTQAEVGGSGERMPKGGEPDEYLTSQIRTWISEGAKDE